MTTDLEKPILLFKKYIEDGRIESGVYYIIKKCFIKLFDIFINSVVLDEKYEIVSKVYKEMNVKHVLIALEIETIILKYLMDQENNLKKSENELFIDLNGRINIICDLIDTMKVGYNPDIENIVSNNKFIEAGKLFLQNIRVLKYLREEKFSKVPLDELEYYLSIYLIVITRENYDDIIDPVVIFILDLSKLWTYLDSLKLVLQNNDFNINMFKELNETYIKLRNMCSLRRIIYYLEAAVNVDLYKNQSLAVLVIQRTFQVFGEHLNDTKMSDDLKYILCCHTFSGFSENIQNIRNFFSHIGSMIHRWKSDIDVDTLKKIQLQLTKNLPIIKHMILKEKQIIFKSFINGSEKQAIIDRFRYSRQAAMCFSDFDEIVFKIKHPHQEIVNLIKEIIDFLPSNEVTYEVNEMFKQISLNPFKLDGLWHSFMGAIKGSSINTANVENYVNFLQKSCYHFDNDNSGESNLYLSIMSLINMLIAIFLTTKKFRNEKITKVFEKLLFFEESNLFESLYFDLYKSKYQPTDLIRKIDQEFNRITNNIKSKSIDVLEEIEQEKNIYNNSLKLSHLLNKETVSDNDFIKINDLNKQLGSIIDCKDLEYRFKNKNLSTLSHKVDSIKCQYKTLLKNIGQYYKNEFNVKLKEQSFYLFFQKFSSNEIINNELKLIFEDDKRELQSIVDKRYELFNEITSNSKHSNSTISNIMKKCSNNSSLRIGIEMIGLDMSVILKNLDKYPFDTYFMDEYSSIICGRTMRNYLAHGDMLYELIIDDCSKQVIANLGNIFNNLKNIWNLQKNLVSKPKSELFLKNKIKNIFNWSESQSTLWKTVLDNEFNDINKVVSDGADVNINSKILFNLPKENKNFTIGSKLSILHKKVLWNNKDDVLIYLKNNKNIEINKCDDQGNTPLHYAVFHENYQIAKTLLDYGADVNAVPKSKKTPLVLSCFNQDVNMSELLIQYGATLNHLNILEPVLLKLAVVCNKITIIEMFRKLGKINKTFEIFLIAISLDLNEIAEIFLKQNYFKVENLFVSTTARKNSFKMIKLFYERKIFTKNTVFPCRYTLLMHAAEGNAVDVIKVLINLGFDINAINDKGNTALHCAAAYGQGNAIRELLKAKAKANIKNLFEQIPLHLAANTSCLLANELLANKTDLMIPDDNDWTSLHRAAYYNQAEVIKLFLTKGADINIRTKIMNSTPLHLACQSGSLKAVIALVENKADLNVTKFGDITTTPLIKAVGENQIAIVKFLISKGAEVHRGTVDLAIGNSQFKMLTVLLQQMSEAVKNEMLVSAILNEELEKIKILISCGVNIYSANEEVNPMLSAILKRSIPVLDLLIESGGNLFSKDSCGSTLLHTAAHSSITEIVLGERYSKSTEGNIVEEKKTIDLVKYLIKKGLNVNDVNNKGNTPLHFAAKQYSNNLKLYEELINNGALLNIQNLEGLTPLHYTCFIKNLPVQDLLSDTNNINIYNSDGLTPLHTAVQNDQSEAVELLIKKGADVNIKTRDGNEVTPLHFAVNLGYLECVRVLINNKADINMKDGNNTLPISHSIVHERSEVLKYLLEQKAIVDLDVLNLALRLNKLKVTKLIVDSFSLQDQMKLLRDAVIKKNYLVITFFKFCMEKLLSVDGFNDLIKTFGTYDLFPFYLIYF